MKKVLLTFKDITLHEKDNGTCYNLDDWKKFKAKRGTVIGWLLGEIDGCYVIATEHWDDKEGNISLDYIYLIPKETKEELTEI